MDLPANPSNRRLRARRPFRSPPPLLLCRRLRPRYCPVAGRDRRAGGELLHFHRWRHRSRRSHPRRRCRRFRPSRSRYHSRLRGHRRCAAPKSRLVSAYPRLAGPGGYHRSEGDEGSRTVVALQLRQELLQLGDSPGGLSARSAAGRSRQARRRRPGRSWVPTSTGSLLVGAHRWRAVDADRSGAAHLCAATRKDPASRSVRSNMSSLSPTAAPDGNSALGPIRQQRTEQTANAGAERIQHCSGRDVVISGPTLPGSPSSTVNPLARVGLSPLRWVL